MDKEYFCTVTFEGSRPYYFKTTIEDLKKGDNVVVETIRGFEFATIYKGTTPIEELNCKFELKSVIRRANNEDVDKYNQNLEASKYAEKLCSSLIERFQLDMKLLQTQYVLDKSKVIFTYSSDNRVDFRELLKELASSLKCRIELKQIGSRDRAKLIGGLGACGMPLCCTSFMDNFDVISINMAKNQFLALNIQKLSGQCGKLMCCLKFEDEEYTEIRKTLPKINTRLDYDGENYKITNINILTSQVRLENQNNTLILNLNDVLDMLNK